MSKYTWDKDARLYQHKGLAFWQKYFSVYFAVDMGLGKTAMILQGLKELGKPALIIAPLKPMYSTWPDEIEDWGLDLTYTILHGKDKNANLDKDVDIYLCNPEGIKWLYNALVKRFKLNYKLPMEVLIVDEGSMWKAPGSERLKFIKGLLPLFPKHRAVLSGTPSPNGLQDLWSQYFILDDGKALFKSYYKFRNKYFIKPSWSMYDYVLRDGADERIYKRIESKTFRLDEKDHLTLPDRLYVNTELELSSKLRKQYKELEKNFILEFEDAEVEASSAATLSGKLRQFLQGGLYTDDKGAYELIHTIKLKALADVLETLDGKPLMCAVQFKFEREMILKKFPKTPFIAGGTSPVDAARYMRQWNRGEIPLLCVHPISVGHGTNLQFGGHNMLWYGLPWSLEQYQQLNKRLHRSGQKNTVVINHLLIKNSIDDRLVEVLGGKDIGQRKLLDYLREVTREKLA